MKCPFCRCVFHEKSAQDSHYLLSHVHWAHQGEDQPSNTIWCCTCGEKFGHVGFDSNSLKFYEHLKNLSEEELLRHKVMDDSRKVFSNG